MRVLEAGAALLLSLLVLLEIRHGLNGGKLAANAWGPLEAGLQTTVTLPQLSDATGAG